MASLTFKHVKKRYGNNPYTVKDFDLEVADKEFLVLVGPSGCGKTTTLRMVAGLEEISEGELYMGDRLINHVPPKDRDIAMVFQNHALYPHMNVYQNMAFGLKMKKVPSTEIDRKVREAAKILDVEHLLERKPGELSGGQRQRVALGRAIVGNPQVFLMDEPLSNLDAKLRVQMRTEIVKLHKRLETTVVYVTHDQTEAMTMADRIVVMYNGLIQQVATPQEIYNYPANMYVAGFIGSPSMNFIRGTAVEDGANLYFKHNEILVRIPDKQADPLRRQRYVGQEVIFGIRPEDIHDQSDGEAGAFLESRFQARVDVAENMGAEQYLHLIWGDVQITARVNNRTEYRRGQQVSLWFDMDKSHFFDKTTEKAIR